MLYWQKGCIMGRFTVVAGMMVVLTASAAMAGIKTNKPMGPIVLDIASDGTGVMTNNGAEPFSFDGYEILSEDGLLGDPFGIIEHVFADGFNGTDTLYAALGMTFVEGLSWSKMVVNPHRFVEATLYTPATLQPGASIDLGQAFVGFDQADGVFLYYDSRLPTGQNTWEGAIIPEPATLSLLALGALAAVRRRGH